ncbi:MAG: hypothetical protein CVU00_04890 [Bacteroidetes bacterium HGW-Bacteroidetes-17]|nr:MAG: hypothetical protein CVU00_04890 [Bacteroidetes bacterium HGW-Bacteroidetes-17]
MRSVLKGTLGFSIHSSPKAGILNALICSTLSVPQERTEGYYKKLNAKYLITLSDPATFWILSKGANRKSNI